MDGSGLCIHRIHNCQRLQVITQISDTSSAELEAFFDDNTDPLYHSARGFGKDFFFLMIFLRCLDLYGIESLTIHSHDR